MFKTPFKGIRAFQSQQTYAFLMELLMIRKRQLKLKKGGQLMTKDYQEALMYFTL